MLLIVSYEAHGWRLLRLHHSTLTATTTANHYNAEEWSSWNSFISVMSVLLLALLFELNTELTPSDGGNCSSAGQKWLALRRAVNFLLGMNMAASAGMAVTGTMVYCFYKEPSGYVAVLGSVLGPWVKVTAVVCSAVLSQSSNLFMRLVSARFAAVSYAHPQIFRIGKCTCIMPGNQHHNRLRWGLAVGVQLTPLKSL
jgi:hypothetical protein